MSAPVSFVVAATTACLLAALGYVLLGPVAAVVFAVFLVGSLIAWRLTTYGCPADPEPVVVPYLLAVIFFIVHVGEEYVTGFWGALGSLTGRDISQANFVIVAALAGPILWLFGLVLFYMRTEIGNWLVWAFVVAMTVSELAHFVFPFMAYGTFGYFSGLYTAALPLVPAWVVAVRLIRAGKAC